MSPFVWVAVVLIGGCGAVLRFLVDSALADRLGREFPFGTFVINISGALALGLLAGASLGRQAALLAATAAVGSYTTFSTWMYETHRLGEERQNRAALANVVLSLALGVAAAALGRWVTRHG